MPHLAWLVLASCPGRTTTTYWFSLTTVKLKAWSGTNSDTPNFAVWHRSFLLVLRTGARLSARAHRRSHYWFWNLHKSFLAEPLLFLYRGFNVVCVTRLGRRGCMQSANRNIGADLLTLTKNQLVHSFQKNLAACHALFILALGF